MAGVLAFVSAFDGAGPREEAGAGGSPATVTDRRFGDEAHGGEILPLYQPDSPSLRRAHLQEE